MRNFKKTIKATMDGSSFQIEIVAKIKTKNLASFEAGEVSRKLKQNLANGIAGLPYSDIYPHEVVLK